MTDRVQKLQAEGGPGAFLRMLVQGNRPGFIGFLLSLLQLAGHAGWMFLVWRSIRSGTADKLTASDGTAWGIVLLLGGSLLLTFISMFVCLYFGLRKVPRVLPLIGLCLSFFTGVLATFMILLG